MDRVAQVAGELSGLIKIRTVSSEVEGFRNWDRVGESPNWYEFLRLTWLDEMIQFGAQELFVDENGNLAVLIPSDHAEKRSVIFHAHVDVVGVENAELWSHDPFAGQIQDGKVWGRGATDMKGWLVSCWSAMLQLLRSGQKPSRPVILLVTVDEELGGFEGAGKVMKDLHRLEQMGNPCWFFTEGGMVLPDLLGNIVTAAIGVTEKQVARIELTFKSEGGHAALSSSTGAKTVVQHLEQALAVIRRFEPAAEINPILLEGLGLAIPHASLLKRFLLQYRDHSLVQSVLLRLLEQKPEMKASLKSTLAVTGLDSGSNRNVAMSSLTMTLDCRLGYAKTVDELMMQLKQALGDLPVEMTSKVFNGDPGVVQVDNPFFRAVEQAVASSMPQVQFSMPVFFPATTDGRWATEAGLDVLRFFPWTKTTELIRGVHGVDEHLTFDDLGQGDRFFTALFRLL
jgi:carboxypeptidase PM20D1